MRGRYPMPGQDEYKVVGTPAPAVRHARASLADLLAFLWVLVLAGGLVLLADRTGQFVLRDCVRRGRRAGGRLRERLAAAAPC